MLVFLTACHFEGGKPATFDAAKDWSTVDCADAGARIESLQCRDEKGRPLWVTPKGKPFSEVCKNAPYDFHASSIANIKSCDQIDSAYRVKP